jgi:hypothetical protein
MEMLAPTDSAIMIALLRRLNGTLWIGGDISGERYERNEADFKKSILDAGITDSMCKKADELIMLQLMPDEDVSDEVRQINRMYDDFECAAANRRS